MLFHFFSINYFLQLPIYILCTQCILSCLNIFLNLSNVFNFRIFNPFSLYCFLYLFYLFQTFYNFLLIFLVQYIKRVTLSYITIPSGIEYYCDIDSMVIYFFQIKNISLVQKYANTCKAMKNMEQVNYFLPPKIDIFRLGGNHSYFDHHFIHRPSKIVQCIFEQINNKISFLVN